MVLLGVGSDGHFCGIPPNTTKFGDLTSRVNANATPEMADVLLSEVGGDKEKQPDFYVTMGTKKHHAGEEIGNDRQWQEKSRHRQNN